MSKPASFRTECSRTRYAEWARADERLSTGIMRIPGQAIIGRHVDTLAEAEVSCFTKLTKYPFC